MANYKDPEILKMSKFLSEYHYWSLRSKRITPKVGSVKMDGMPKGSSPDPNVALDRHANAKNEAWKRKRIVELVRSEGDDYQMSADLLDWRYLHGLTRVQTIMRLYEKYHWSMSERVYRYRQDLALRRALVATPREWLDRYQPQCQA